jgi:hypothetical protein
MHILLAGRLSVQTSLKNETKCIIAYNNTNLTLLEVQAQSHCNQWNISTFSNPTEKNPLEDTRRRYIFHISSLQHSYKLDAASLTKSES